MENLETQTTEQTQDSTQVTEQVANPEGQAGPIDLDTVDKVRWQGKEWTTKELQSQFMAQSDYSKKTQAMAEERKALQFYENLNVDLAKIKKDPSLANEFRQIYPQKFHSYLQYVLNEQAKTEVAEQKQEFQLPKEWQEKLSKVDRVLQESEAKDIAAIGAEIDSRFKVLSAKYPMADEEAVISRAQYLLDKNKALPEDQRVIFDDKAWDAIWKSVHDRTEALSKKYYSEQVKKQSSANARGKDASSSGGIPGSAPKVAKTIKEAGELYREHMGETG